MLILVTGAAGFIGSATAASFAELGFDVVAVDNFSPYYSIDLKRLRIETLLKNPKIKFVECDLSNRYEVVDLFKSYGFESVIHLAAQAGVRLQISDWDKYVRDNLLGFSNILNMSAEASVHNFIYASSSSVYGNSNESYFREKELEPNPVSFYGVTKRTNEILASSVSRLTGLKTRGLRFFTVYGPWGRPDMVYFRMVTSAITKVPFDFYGDGKIERDFTYVSDVVDLTTKLLYELETREIGFADTVNIGGGKPKSINDILEIIQDNVGLSVPFKDRKSTRLNSSHVSESRMPSSA